MGRAPTPATLVYELMAAGDSRVSPDGTRILDSLGGGDRETK